MSDSPSPTPPLPEQPTGPAAAAPPPAASVAVSDQPVEGTGLAPNLAAALASFFLLLGGIVFLIIEKKNQYVRFYAMQSVFLGGVWFGLSMAVLFVTLLLHGIPLIGTLLWLVSLLIRLGLLVLWIVLVVKAYSGKEWEIPVLGKLAREQLQKSTPTAS